MRNRALKKLIDIDNTGSGSVYGVWGYYSAMNAYKDWHKKITNAKYGNVVGEIVINNVGDGNVYGVRADSGHAFNVWNNHGSDSFGYITIEKNQGNGNVFGLYAAGETAYNALYQLEEHNVGGGDNSMRTIAKIIMGSEGTESVAPTNNLSGGGNVYGLYTQDKNAVNGKLETAKEPAGTVTKSLVQATVQIYHTTPNTVNNAVYIRGMQVGGSTGYNAEGRVNSVVQPAEVDAQIVIREKNDSASTVYVRGAQTSGTFYNALYDSNPNSAALAETDVMRGDIKGSVFINSSHGTGSVESIGILANAAAYNAYTTSAVNAGRATGKIVIHTLASTNNDNVATTKGYGMSSNGGILANAYSNQNLSSSILENTDGPLSNGYIEVTGGGDLRGMSGGNLQYNAAGYGRGEINVVDSNVPAGKGAYGMYGGADSALYNDNNTTEFNSKGIISVFARGLGNGYGMYGGTLFSSQVSHIQVDGIPGVEEGIAKGSYRGMAAKYEATNDGTISVALIGPKYEQATPSETYHSNPTVTEDRSSAIGIWGDVGAKITNAQHGKIEMNYRDSMDVERVETVVNKNTNGESVTRWTREGEEKWGTAYGIYSEGNGAIITNNGSIYINDSFKKAYGIYVKDGTNVNITNTGTIEVSGSGDNHYGIFVAANGSGTTITNSGTITVGNTTYNTGTPGIYKASLSASTSSPGSGLSAEAFDHIIHLGGATLNNASVIESSVPIDFDAVDGDMNISEGGVYEAPSLSGHLGVDNSVVTKGFENTYTLTNALKADDTTGLVVDSNSALFTASKAAGGSDIVMQMKSFDSVVDNASLAGFLQQNYANRQNEKLFSMLKQAGSVAGLQNRLNALTGRDMFRRLNFEDMSMMRELNVSMNQKLFAEPQSFSLSETVKPALVKGNKGSNIRYSLMNKRMGNKSIGLGVAFSNLQSQEDGTKGRRSQMMYQMVVPFGYHKDNLQLITSPRLGYARGTYDRKGWNDTDYDGVLEKRVYGLTNEARYTIDVGEWKLYPTAEFNVMGYQQKGHEYAKAFSLTIPNQNTLSVESGIGFYASREKQLAKGVLNLSAGVMAYHEFADPYTVRLKMHEMQGSFQVRDEERGDNRSVFRAGFDYQTEEMDVYGNLISEFSKELNTSAKTGVRIKF